MEGEKTQFCMANIDGDKMKEGSYISHNEKVLSFHLHELAALHSISKLAGNAASIDVVVHAVVDRVFECLNPDVVLIFKREHDDLELLESKVSNDKFRHSETPIHRVGECMCGLAVKEKKPLYSLNINTDARCTWQECKEVGLVSFAALPLVIDNAVIGLLGVASATERDFTKENDFLEILAFSVAMQMHNAILYSSLRSKTKQLQSVNDKLHEEVVYRKSVEDTLQVLIQDLERKNIEIETFLYSVSHDLKNQMVTISNYLQIYQSICQGNCDDSKKILGRVVNAAGKLQQLLEDLFMVARKTRSLSHKQKIDCNLLVKDAVALVRDRIDKRNIELVIKGPFPFVKGDRQRLLDVFFNLLDNAIKFTENVIEARIEIGVRSDKSSHTFYIKDNGIGIASGYQDKIFGLFYKLDVDSEGTGLGLVIAKRIIELHQGNIDVASKGPGKGSEFFFTLPA